ncbi:MAG: amidase, partial [Candidatus Competibacterales bacterium]|nr:amidase [Candidatus Competibacterales bacterium]
LPLLVKDNLVVGGLPATWGSPLYADFVPAEDEIPVARLRAAGAVILGKTNVPEFTLEGYTDNPLFGVTPNPWNPALTPGGSSGGSVAAVAAGMVPWAIGTDGGGSIRRPAAYTGLVGLKPSIGRIARGGGLPQLLLDMEVVGPITRTVRDQALMLEVLAGSDRRDYRSRGLAPLPPAEQLLSTPDRLRILAVERFADAPLDPDIAESFRKTLAHLEDCGHHVTEGPLPLDIDPITEAWGAIGQIGLARLLDAQPGMAELATAKYVEWARTPHTAAELLEILDRIDALRNQATAAFETIDLIMTPSCAAMPWSTQIPFPPEIDGQRVGPRGSAVYTGWVNACGLPSISLPGPPAPSGLPIGMQYVAPFGREDRLLRLGSQLQSILGWYEIWPELAFRS